MSRREDDIAAADAAAQAARAQMLDTLGTTRARLAPAALRQEATNAAKDAALDRLAQARLYAQGHPMQVVGLAAAVGAIVARRPLGLVGRKLLAMGQSALVRHLAARRRSGGE